MLFRNKLHTILLVLLLLYGALLTLSDLDYNSCYMDEAIPILIGQQLLRGEICTGCPYMTGSVLIQPVFTAIGESLGGLRGARAMNILFGLGATLIIYCTARLLLGKKYGLIAATLFLLSGQTLYLMKLATYDMIAAFFLSAAFLLIVVAEKAETQMLRNVALFEAAIVLAIASIAKYILPVFMPFLLLYVLYRQGWMRTIMFVVVPFCTLGAIYYLFAPFAPRAETFGQIENARTISQLPVTTLAV
ncbi:MAG: glycosyltransferase family 39 protein, partial [Candidatus Krumholzibacteria bacterium]|nr:glycosyltransferase family 39 protein [Candidatus Krumholzibacteria bacterium]